MTTFDMASYLNNRFSAVGTGKVDELNAARDAKINSLQNFRAALAGNAPQLIAERAAQEESWVGQAGLDAESFAGSAVNLVAEGISGVSRLVGTGVSAIPGLEARRIEGQLASEDYRAWATPEQATALEERAVKARQAETNITEAFNRNDIVDQTDRNKLQSELKAGFTDPWKQYTEGGQRVYDGDLAGAGDIVSGMARLLYTAGKAAVDNPRAALGYAAENTPQLAVGAIPGVGPALMAGSNMSYGNELYSRGIENYRAANNGAMPPDDELKSMAMFAASAVAAEQAGDMFTLGSVKAGKAITKAGFKESLKNIGSVGGKNYLTEGGTEGYQTFAEGAATGENVTASDIFTGSAIGAMSGAQMSGAGRTLSELTQTTPEATERRQQAAVTRKSLDEAVQANDTSTFLDPQAKTYDPQKAVGVLYAHTKLADVTPEVKAANLLKAREIVQSLEQDYDKKEHLLDLASMPSEVQLAKEELVNLKERLKVTEPSSIDEVTALTQQIAFREQVVALSTDKVALKRLSGEVKSANEQLSNTKKLQEAFADRLRTSVTTEDVATHINKVNRAMSVDNMPDMEDSRQSAQALVNIAMVSPDSISTDSAMELVNNVNNALSTEQRDYFRQFSEARQAENKLMTLNKVSQAIFTGSKNDVGIIQYRKTIGQALEANDQRAAEKSLGELTQFAQDHAQKQALATELFSKVRISGDKQVRKLKKGGWEVAPQGKPLADWFVSSNGGFTIHPNSGEFVGNMQAEAEALNTAVAEQQAAFALKFGKPATNVSTKTTKVDTSSAPVQKAEKSVQVTPAPVAQTTAAPTSVAPVVTPIPVTLSTKKETNGPQTSQAQQTEAQGQEPAGAVAAGPVAPVEVNLIEALDAIKTGVSSVGAAKFVPNKEQAEGIAKIQAFLKAPSSAGNIFVLEGKAGTGKTSLVQEAVAQHLRTGGVVTISAISHKAKGVLQNKLEGFIATNGLKGEVKATTVASLLGMKRDEITGNFVADPYAESGIEMVTLLVVDEASMVNAQNKAILEAKLPANAKLIYLGDRNQIAPIEAPNSKNSGKISEVFTMDTGKNKHSLVTRVRQGEDSTILPYADHYWNSAESGSTETNPVPAESRQNTAEMVMLKGNGWVDQVIPLFQRALKSGNANLVKVMAFNNMLGKTAGAQMLKAAEQKIREALFGTGLKEYNKGELLIMTGSFKVSKTETLENSTELVAESAKATKITVPTADGSDVRLDAFMLTVKDTVSGESYTVPVIADAARAEHKRIVEAWFAHAKLPGNRSAYRTAYQVSEGIFAPVAYSYILTTHKAQGSTYDVAVVLEDNIQQSPGSAANVSRIMYTAITRAAKLAVIVSNKNTEQTATSPVKAKTAQAEEDLFMQDEDASSDEEFVAPRKTSQEAMQEIQGLIKDRVFRALSDTEQASVDRVLARLQTVFGKEIADTQHFFVQERTTKTGTFFGGYNIIGLNPDVFNKPTEGIDATAEDRLFRTLAHEFAHVRDYLQAELIDGEFVYPTENIASLQPGGKTYVAAEAAMEKSPVLKVWFANIMSGKLPANRVPRELYAQLYALYLTKPELMNEETGLTSTYQAIKKDIGYHEKLTDSQRVSDGSGVSEEVGNPPNASNTGTEEEGSALRATRESEITGDTAFNGGLDALTAEPKSKPGTAYQDRNLLVDHFSQTVAGLTAATQRPLVVVKNFVSGLADGTVALVEFLKDYKKTDKQEAALALFAKAAAPTSKWSRTIQGLLIHGYFTNTGKYNEDKKHFYQNPFNWMISKDESGVYSIEENTNTALVYAALTTMLELADAPAVNDKKTINAILGRDEGALVPYIAENVLGGVGTLATLVRNNAGQTAVSALGLKVDDKAGQDLKPKLEGGMGAMVEALLLSLGLAESDSIPAATMNAVLDVTNEMDGKKEGKGHANRAEVRSFLKLARDPETGEYTTAVQEILTGLKGSNNVLDKLMSVEATLKYPSLTPIVSTQTTTKTGQQVPDLLTDTNNQNSSQANFAREEMWTLLNAVSDDLAGAMAGVEEISETKTQNTKVSGIKAKNDGLWRELNRYKEYVEDVLLGTPDQLKQPIYFDYSVWLQQRVGIATNVINPQTSKAHRALFYRKDWESTVELTNDDMLDNFMLRVGEGFGIKTDRNTVAASLASVAKLLLDPVVVKAVAALQQVPTEGKMPDADQAALLAAVKLGGENFHTLDALVALAAYQTALDTGAKTFVTHIQAEVDGVANGPILGHALFGAAPDVNALNVTMERGGIFTEQSGEKAFNDWKADPANRDLYEHTVAKIIDSIAASIEATAPALTNAIYFFTGTLSKDNGDITSDGRKIIKGPVTEMVFGSGVAKSIDHMAELFIDKVYDVLEKATNGDEKYPMEAVLKNLNLLFSEFPSIKPLTLQDAKKFNTEFFLDGVEAGALKAQFKGVFAEPVTEAIETNFADFLARRTAFTKAAEFTHGLYSTVYDAMRQEMLDKLVADDLVNPGTGIASTYKTNPVTKVKETVYLRDLSKAEERQLEKQLAAMFPVVQTLFSKESQQPKAGLRIGKFKQSVSNKEAYETKANLRQGQNSSKATTVRGMEKTHEGPGVAMLPLLIHSLDSYISHSAQMGMQMLNIHDAVITGLNTIYEASSRMNEQTFHALLSFSPMTEMYQALENTVTGLGNLPLSDATSAALADYLAKFAVDNEMEAGNVLAQMLQTTKAAATKADTIKFTAMQQWAYVNQYARENSSYAVTEADQAKISKALDAVTSEVPATAVLAANNTYASVHKALSTAYATQKRKADWVAEQKAKKQKRLSKDDMPDVSSPTTQTYSTHDLYNALSSNPVSTVFDTHLKDVLTNIVEKLHGAFGSFRASLKVPTDKTALEVMAEAFTTGKMPLSFSLAGSGLQFNDQQMFVAEQVHATVLAALDSPDGRKTAVYTELSKLFRETRLRLKDSAWAKDPATSALYERIFNQVPADTEGKSNYLAEFAALGLAHEEFNALLKVPTTIVAEVFADTTILGVLKRLFNKILETFNGKLTGTVAGQNADLKLKALVTRLVEIENKRERVLNAERHGLLKFIDARTNDVREGKYEIISKIVNSPKFMKNRNVFIASASGVIATVADSQVGLFFRNIDKVRNKHFQGIQGMTMGFLGEMNGPKPVIQGLLRTIKYFEGQRKKIITMTGKFVLQGFDNQGKDLKDYDKRALTKVLLHTGAHTLLDHFDTDKLLTLLKDSKALDKEIQKFEGDLSVYTQAQQEFFVEQSRALGYWLVTGDATHEIMMRNANNIARGFMSGKAGGLTEEQVATATKTLDALSSLYALAYTNEDNKKSVVKSLTAEQARTDGGNGVRLLLLSHKEMEQQARERLFSGSEALMAKGYVPEIYNPHTDVKAANLKEGRDLEALGYVRGDAVSHDPADGYAEAKHLYTLRDGGPMPWLSGIFSFTGMNAKGSSHHGKKAHRTQQAVTQDKLIAIQKRVKAGNSGFNFDPTKITQRHMVPLMNGLGQAVNYQYMMRSDTKDGLLERDTRFDSVMGALNGSIFDKENSSVHNAKAVDVFFKEFDEGYIKEPKAYLEVSATSTEPELREIYKMLPQATKDHIRKVWGTDAMMVRSSQLDIAFGYRKLSISSMFDKEKDDRNALEEAAVWFSEAALRTAGRVRGMSSDEADRYAKRAAVYVRRGENVWKELVTETKDIFVIKSGVTALANIMSNLTLLKLYGVGTVTGLKDMRVAWLGAQAYQQDTERLFTLESQLASKAITTGLSDVKQEIAQLKDAIARNPVRELIEAGLMPTIVEDVSADEDIYAYKKEFVRKTEKYTNKLNKGVKTAARQLYMAHDTQLYKGMSQLTQLSDFVARYALYQHLTTRKDNPIKKDVAIQEASDAFINYDVPMHRNFQYLDDMGIMMFTKYFMRIQRVIRGRFKHAPGKVALLLLAQGYLDMFPTALDASILFKFGNNPFSWGALQFPGSLDEMMTTKAALSLFK